MTINSLNRLELVLHRFGDANEAEATAAFSRFRALCKANEIHPVDLRLRHAKGAGDLRRAHAEDQAQKYLTQIVFLETKIASLDAHVASLQKEIVQLQQNKSQLEHTTLRLQQIIDNMTKSPPKRSSPRSSSKKTGRASDVVVAMLQRPEGASLTEITQKMEWLPHTTRSFIARTIRQKLGHKVVKTKTQDRGTVYRIVNTSAA